VLFTIWTASSFDNARIGVLSLETGEHRALVDGGTYARYVPLRSLGLCGASGLLAVPFDSQAARVTGPRVSILEGVSMNHLRARPSFSSSADGSLAYVPEGLRSASAHFSG